MGPKLGVKLGGENQGFVRVTVRAPGSDGRADPVAVRHSEMIQFVPGERNRQMLNFKIPLPQNAQAYPVTFTFLGTLPDRTRMPDGTIRERPPIMSQRGGNFKVPADSEAAARAGSPPRPGGG